MSSPWIQHALAYKQDHGCSFKTALESSSASYRSKRMRELPSPPPLITPLIRRADLLPQTDVIQIGPHSLPYMKGADGSYLPTGTAYKTNWRELKRISINNKSHVVSKAKNARNLYYTTNPRIYLLVDKEGSLTHVSPLKPPRAENRNRVIKVVRVGKGEKKKVVEQEVRIQSFLGERGLAPKVYPLYQGGKDVVFSGSNMLYCMQRMYPIRRWTVHSFDTLLETMRRTIFEHSIVHNDLHQGNVMRTGSGKTLPIDFGLSVCIPEADLDGCGNLLLERILFSQVIMLLEKCNMNNLQCSTSCEGERCMRHKAPFMNALERWVRKRSLDLKVPSKRKDMDACVSYVDRTFPACGPYVKFQILTGTIVYNFLLGCNVDKNMRHCHLIVTEWLYYIRNMPYSDAEMAWDMARRGEDPPS